MRSLGLCRGSMTTDEVLARITDAGLESIATAIAQRARTGQPHCVTTTNLSHLRYLERDPAFSRSYARADVVTADGWPVALLCSLRLRRRVPRVTGADLLPHVASQLRGHQTPIVVVGGSSSSVKAFLRRQSQAEASHVNVLPDETATPAACRDLVARLAATLPTTGLAIVSLSAPRQEYLAAVLREQTNLSILPCGASLDFAAGTRRRAPRLMQRLGIEWLFRIATEPRRLAPRYCADFKALMSYLVRPRKPRP